VKGLVEAAFTCQLCHPEWKFRVWDDLRPVVREAGRRKTLAERVLIAKAVTSMKDRKRDAFGWVLRMQVEWKPHDVGVELAP
jgi:hypothetical protein